MQVTFESEVLDLLMHRDDIINAYTLAQVGAS